jgi:serine-type D-Ala-D-Ala carboxypeptidase (penicillin-binding protein 5/6)
MRTACWGVLVGVVAAVCTPQILAAEVLKSPRITAKAAIIVDAATGSVLWAQAPDEQLPPASTTKVMTAILALESRRLGDSVEASPEACMTAPSKVHLKPGQRLALEDLVYAILLNSANDASVAIAEHLGTSVDDFGRRMTARAHLLGATRTRFANPHGLTEAGHYSTVRDLATIFRYALAVPKFREILGTKAVVVGVENSSRRIALRSHNRLLDSYRIPVIGKTGYTVAAKKCFVGAGRYGDREVIVALMGSRDLWGDTRRLLEFGFDGQLPPEVDIKTKRRATQAASAAGISERHVTRSSGGARATAKRTPQYAIYVGTFAEKGRADRLQRALGKRGFDVAVDRLTDGRGKSKRTRYRVQVGPYADRRQAESAARTMATQVDIPTRVVRR